MDPIKIFQLWAFLFSIHLVSYSLEVDGRSSKLSSSSTHHVKTVKTDYGDIYDCVELYKQPALRHPKLKDHKIKMRPTFHNQKKNNASKKGIPSGLRNGWKSGCPAGTVPIRRTTKKEELKANAFFKQLFQTSVSSNGQENRFAGVFAKGKIEEAGGYMSTHNPSAGRQQLSSSVLSIEHGPQPAFAAVRVGWMVYPDLFNGDNHTRLFTGWAQLFNGSVEGCFNMVCPGFVQVNHDIAIDMVIEEISRPGAEYAYIKLGLNLDDDNSWWFNYGEDKKPIGYWPKALFDDLQNGGELVNFGGWVATLAQELPMMGSGLLGNLGSLMRQISGESHDGDAPDFNVVTNTCYKAADNPFGHSKYWGVSFWYGGNGGDIQHCPQ